MAKKPQLKMKRMIDNLKKITFFMIGLWLMVLSSCSKLPTPAKPEPPPAEQTAKIRILIPKIQSKNYYGFNIYRSESRDGPFIKVNKQLILAPSPEEKTPQYYIDEPLIKGKVYYYYIEGIDYLGKKERITPVTKFIPQ
ncbi:MAG: hypothetical protein N2246_06020 [Candidatus Sumerlaeia bacterium]|nr:hypothetical protein [Candidatus Sumerlaeia bacterium]